MTLHVALFFILYSIPPTSLLVGTHYEKMADAFQVDGYHAATTDQLHHALSKAFVPNRVVPVVINVEVHPSSARKPQVQYLYIWFEFPMQACMCMYCPWALLPF